MFTHQKRRGKQADISADGFLGFGKHEDCHISEVPANYLRWALEQAWISNRLREAITSQLEIDQAEDDTEPDPTSAAVALPLIIWQWTNTMFRAFDGNEDALEVVGRGLIELKALCSTFTNRPWLTEGGSA